MESDRAKKIAQLKKQAESGDREAAKFLLQEFVNHADAIAKGSDAADRIVVEFLARAIKAILAGKNLALALGIDTKEGRPAVPIERDILLAYSVHRKQIELKCSIGQAINSIAAKAELDREVVRRAWRLRGKGLLRALG